MTTLTAQPELMTTAAADVADIRSAIGAANTAAAVRTTGLLAAAGDEVSAACATLFNTYGAEYQAAIAHASAFHGQFAKALAAAGNTYAEAESANATGLAGALGRITSPVQSLLGGGAAPAAAPVAPVPLPGAGQPLITNTNIALIMSGSGNPIPSNTPGFVTNIFNHYLVPNGFGSYIPSELVTPEGLYPFFGSKELTLDDSVAQGVTILNNTLVGTGEGQHGLLIPGSGNKVVVEGISQSAIISSLEMEKLDALPAAMRPPTSDLSFVLMADQMNPNGGLLARFPDMTPNQPLQLPSLGVTFYGATPADTPYQTTIYTLQYDGFADFPRYPLNVLSDLNAFVGIATVHPTYAGVDPSTLPPGDLVKLDGSVGQPGPGGEVSTNTTYYMMTPPGAVLPLLAPLHAIPVIGKPLTDLLQPDLTTLVNLGYGDPAFGYSTSPANVQTTFGVFHPVNASVVANDLVTGAQQGGTAFVNDLSSLSLASVQSGLSHTLTSMAGTGSTLTAELASALASPASFLDTLQTAIANVGNTITSVGATATELIQPTIDIASAVVTTMPIYDVNLFLQGIGQVFGGDVVDGLVNAFLLPLAADTALVTLAGGFELIVVLSGVGSIVGDITGLV